MSFRIARLAIFFVIFASLLVGKSTAQLRTMVQIGLNATTFGGDTASDFSPAARFSGGLGLAFELTDQLFIQPEVVYAVKGASVKADVQFDDNSEPIPVTARFTVSYFDFPLFIGYQFEGDSFRPRIYAGPYFSYKINAKVSYESVDGGPSFSETDQSVVKWDHGIAAGAAIHFFVGDEEIAVGVRGSLGLADVTKDTEDQDANSALRNRSLGLYAGILF